MGWSPEHLDLIASAQELEIAVHRGDGTPGSWTPIWVVCADGDVFVRTWYRRSTGWFGRILRTGRARIRVPGVEMDVQAEDVGADASLRMAVDDAYRAKYGGSSADRMVGDEAAATTLQLVPAD